MKQKTIATVVTLFIAVLAINTLPALACELIALTPGYWKQRQHFGSWPQGINPTDKLESYFVFPPELGALKTDTLLQALGYNGGKGLEGAARILLRASVAALLNAEKFGKITPSSDGYAGSTSEVIELVNLTMDTLDRDTMLWVASQLDLLNNRIWP